MKHLGKTTDYPTSFDPELLEAIPRAAGRNELGITGALPFVGNDFWQAYEISWLKLNGQADAGVLSLKYNCESESIVESKSLKLYLQSFHMMKYQTAQEVEYQVEQDLSHLLQTSVEAHILPLRKGALASSQGQYWRLNPWQDAELANVIQLDALEFDCNEYEPNAELLRAGAVSEKPVFYITESFRSLCPVTGQPDFASIAIMTEGTSFTPETLGRYLTSFRLHQGFHEQCVEHIYTDLLKLGEFKQLAVLGRFTRRGGIDINPVRALNQQSLDLMKQLKVRQLRQ